MIPDDAVIVIVEKDTEVRQVEKPSGVIQMGPRGFPGILDPEAVAHLIDVSTNPHEDSFSGLTAPSGNDDKWVKIDGDAIVTTDEIPLYPEDIRPPIVFDEKVRVDETTEQSSLSNHIRFPLHVNYGSPEGEHRWRMKGDRSISRTVSFPGEFTESVVVPGEIPIDDQTVVLLHGEDFDNSAPAPLAVTPSNVTISDSGRFGKCFSFNGSNSYINLNTQSPFNTQNWTVDWWENRTALANNATTLSKYSSNGYQSGLLIGYISGGTDSFFYLSSNGSTWNVVSSHNMGWTITLGEWAHRAVVRNGSTVLFFQNGIKTSEVEVGTALPYNNSYNYCIGYYRSSSYVLFNGLIDEFRVSNVPRWTENFTPPSSTYGDTRIPVTYPNNTVFDVSDRVPRRSYYGTDCAGTVGFHIVPGKQVIP